jgi:hypothetical protein
MVKPVRQLVFVLQVILIGFARRDEAQLEREASKARYLALAATIHQRRLARALSEGSVLVPVLG